jgi:hypothetical protein
MFFTELATKDNAVYNNFVDMFSLLTKEGELEEEASRRILKFLAGFIEKVCCCIFESLPHYLPISPFLCQLWMPCKIQD